MDISVIKRQLWHMMFLEENESNPYDVISYNDHEFMNEYEGLKAEFIRFNSSGITTMSFAEYLKQPAWFADWVVEWNTKQNLAASASQSNELENIARQAEIDAKKGVGGNGFMNKSY